MRLIIILLILSAKSYCCTCVGTSTLKEEIKYSKLIFVGKLIEKKTVIWSDSLYLKRKSFKGNKRSYNKVQNYYSNFNLIKIQYTFEVKYKFKGKIKKNKITLISGIGGSDCGFIFDINKDYIVFAGNNFRPNINNGKRECFFETDICTRTRLFSKDFFEEIKKMK